MNKTYRVIFSAARGALMVVNELTSSVQKKGASAIVTAAALTLTSTALMAGTTLVADEGQNVDINIEVPRASEILCPWDNRSPPIGCIQ